MKTKTEPTKIKEEFRNPDEKFAELPDDKLAQVVGGQQCSHAADEQRREENEDISRNNGDGSH
ncbi:MAG: hypothetical protein MJ101_00680 [Clostridia bacterium]|nr:hypothetical protein [Clostridia bacterium]